MQRLLLVLLLTPLLGHAQTLHWKGGDGTWSGTGNWRAGAADGAVTTWVPATTLGADAIIGGLAGNLTINSGSANAISANSVTILTSGYSIRSNATTSATLNANLTLDTDVRLDLGSPTATGDRSLNVYSIHGGTGASLNFVGVPNGGNIVRVSLNQTEASINVPAFISLAPTTENLNRAAGGFVATVSGNTYVNADITNNSGAMTLLGGTESGYRLNLNGRVVGTAPLLVSTNPNGGGLGAVILNNQSTYAGDTFMGLRIATTGTAIGRLQLGTHDALPVTTNLVFGVSGNITSGGDLDLHGFNQTVRSLQVQAAGAVGSVTSSAADTLGTLTVNGPASTTFSLPFRDGLGQVRLVKAGTGTLTLSAASTHTGGTVVSDGTLALTGNGTLGGEANTVTLAGGALDLGGATAATGTVIFAGGAVGNGSLAAATRYELQTGDVGIVLAGVGGLAKTGTANATLSAANTYGGGTTVEAGTLMLTGNGTLGSGAVTLAGGTLDLGGKTQAATTLTLTAGLLANGTVDAAGFTAEAGTVHAVLAGTGALAKTGSGQLTLTGINSYTGGTTVAGGTLHLAGEVASPVAVSGGTLSGSGRIAASATVAADGRLVFTLPPSPAALDPLRVDGALSTEAGATLELAGADVAAGTTWTLVRAGSFSGPLPQLALPTDWHGALAVVGNDLRFTLQRLGGTVTDAWREFHFGSATVTTASAAAADPDGDGWSNLAEFALGLDPLVSDGVAAVTPGTENDRLTLRFVRLAEPSLTYRVEAVDTLSATWTEIWSSSGEQNTAGPVTVTDTVTLAARPTRFLRLRIETAAW